MFWVLWKFNKISAPDYVCECFAGYKGNDCSKAVCEGGCNRN
jgi:hypothetical protein